MIFPMKLIIASIVTFIFNILFLFIVFPKVLKGQIKGMVNLKPGVEVRDMFLKVPFPLDFNVYIFSVQNPEQIHQGAVPIVEEIGPFCYHEWKTKIDVEDVEDNDTISYNPVDTFVSAVGPNCVSPDTKVTVPHPLILGIVNTLSRQKPGALSLINKAFKSIFSNPSTLFITVSGKDLLFDGVVIHCGVQDFAGKAICSQLKGEDSLVKLNENDVAFSLIGPKNATPGKRLRAFRGTRDFHDVGKIMSYDGKLQLDSWNHTKCDEIGGTDGTIFPPFLKKQDGLASFAPDLCRTLVATYRKMTKYDGIPVRVYEATLGDQTKNLEDKCFCTTPDTCMKKGLMDLYKCVNIPIYASQPHFYDSHPSYLKGVKGLNPNEEKHAIKILFEPMSGSPLSARKRLQFSMPLEPNAKVDIFNNISHTILPIFWVEESVDLNNTFTKPLKMLFTVKKTVSVLKYLLLVLSLIGMGVGAYFLFMIRSTVATVQPEKIYVNYNTDNTNDSDFDKNSIDKY